MLRPLIRDEDGVVLLYVTVLTSVLLGIGVLAVDVGRVSTVHSQMQAAADAAALAGARELDGLDAYTRAAYTDPDGTFHPAMSVPGAIDRARAAVLATLNRQDFGDQPGGVTVDVAATCAGDTDASCVRFLRSLPASDDDPITATHATTDPEQARFIEVRVAEAGFSASFAGILGGTRTNQVGATAVAGNDPIICGMPPLFMCNPSEPAGNTNLALPADLTALRGKQIKAVGKGGGTSGYTPGNFGFLCPSGIDDGSTSAKCGAKDLAALLASKSGTCVRRSVMQTKTGANTGPSMSAINTRFDNWDAQTKDFRGVKDATGALVYPPAVNVVQGGVAQSTGQKCERGVTAATADQVQAQPRDACHDTGTCGGRVGDGDWTSKADPLAPDLDSYMGVNHHDPADPTGGLSGFFGLASTDRTRFDLYRSEIEDNRIPDGAGTTASGDAQLEDGNPTCTAAADRPSNTYGWFPSRTRDMRLLEDRRVLPMALVNCNALGNPGGSFSFRPSELAFMFITEPISSPSTLELFLEFIGPLDEGAQDALMRDVVQIYRR